MVHQNLPACHRHALRHQNGPTVCGIGAGSSGEFKSVVCGGGGDAVPWVDGGACVGYVSWVMEVSWMEGEEVDVEEGFVRE